MLSEFLSRGTVRGGGARGPRGREEGLKVKGKGREGKVMGR